MSRPLSRPAPAAPELLVRMDREAPEPLRWQLERELRTAIRTGRLPAGAELPSTRALSADLGLSRGIVVSAYEQLRAEGYLLARRGSATTVAAGGASTEAHAERSGREVPVPDAPIAAARYDFRPEVPDTSMFPRRSWHKSVRKVLSTAATGAMDYPDARGVSAVRTALSEYLNRARRTAARADRIVICSGFTQGFRLACTVLKAQGTRAIATEDPCHEEQHEAIRAAGLKVVSVPVDEKGILVERLAKTAARAVLVTPAHQYPMGCVLAPERRAALLDWARREDAFV